MMEVEKKKKTEGEKKKRRVCGYEFHLFFPPRSSTPMPKDTQDPRKSLCSEIVLMILRLADEDMLNESGNPVYLKMKRELEMFR